MHGPQFAKSYVNEYLKFDIPVRIISYRNGWSVDDITLPTPVDFFIHEPIAMDAWPTIITAAISTYVWARSDGAEAATTMRDRLTTVLRAAILDYPCLKAYDDRNSFRAMIDESTLREEFSDLTLLKGDRFLAGSYISYTLQIDEIVSREPIGTLNEIDLEVTQTGVQLDPDTNEIKELPTFEPI
jgi:hypothetical protein